LWQSESKPMAVTITGGDAPKMLASPAGTH